MCNNVLKQILLNNERLADTLLKSLLTTKVIARQFIHVVNLPSNHVSS